MSESEEVLSLDLEEEDYLYRIRRGQRVVYVSVLDTTIIPREARTDGTRVLPILRSLPPWNQKWQTLTITKSSGHPKYALDTFLPHTIDLDEVIYHQFNIYNLLDLDHLDRISDRLSQVAIDGSTYILKIARFQFEVEAMKNEISIYNVLHNHKFDLAPQIFWTGL